MVRKPAFFYILLLLTLLFVVDAGYHKPVYQIADSIPLVDKIGHFVFMGTLCLLVNLNINNKMLQLGKMRLQQGSLIVFLIVSLEELSQGLLPHCTLSWMDRSADFLGILLVSYLSLYIGKRITRSGSSYSSDS